MKDQIEKARAFNSLHSAKDPLILYNVWDAGSARKIEASGARAIATSSWSVAAAHGLDDGEALPLDDVVGLASKLAAASKLPVTVDFEGAYAVEPEAVARNVNRLIKTGVVGLNLEDQVVGAPGLYAIGEQARRIGAARAAANETDVPVFINARTDLFLKNETQASHRSLIAEALERAAAYREAGADGFFVPALSDPDLVRTITEEVALPINVMVGADCAKPSSWGEVGVARVSYGPAPYIALMNRFEENAKRVSG